VHYQPIKGEKSFLGIFSLFPPNNPGTFIIATQGKLETGGIIIVSLNLLQEPRDLNEIRVLLKRISLIGDRF
jgi:hypothetical protein